MNWMRINNISRRKWQIKEQDTIDEIKDKYMLKMNTDLLNKAAERLGYSKSEWNFEYSEEDEYAGWYKEVNIIKKGGCFGELSLISHKPRAATIRWTQNTHFAIIDKHNYQTI